MSVVALPAPADLRALASDLVYGATVLLDARDWSGWLDLCAPAFTYAIRSYSPEIRRDMTWLEHDLAGMRTLVDLLPKHQSDRSALTRHVSVYRTAVRQDGDVDIVSSVAVFRTVLDGGATSLFAVGKYYDVVRPTAEARFVSRTLRLETRELGMGTHFPL